MFRVRILVQLPTLSHSYRHRRQPATRTKTEKQKSDSFRKVQNFFRTKSLKVGNMTFWWNQLILITSRTVPENLKEDYSGMKNEFSCLKTSKNPAMRQGAFGKNFGTVSENASMRTLWSRLVFWLV